jgi:hypothetical protein
VKGRLQKAALFFGHDIGHDTKKKPVITFLSVTYGFLALTDQVKGGPLSVPSISPIFDFY